MMRRYEFRSPPPPAKPPCPPKRTPGKAYTIYFFFSKVARDITAWALAEPDRCKCIKLLRIASKFEKRKEEDKHTRQHNQHELTCDDSHIWQWHYAKLFQK